MLGSHAQEVAVCRGQWQVFVLDDAESHDGAVSLRIIQVAGLVVAFLEVPDQAVR